ncbi:hypothetical protein NKH19_31565 [Mesorhizobium sp. M1338]|uniref:hypothetical protein n=1 Tax=Mesorhizobium sp. M1338 TaxID=2957085 RepID=UPI00333DC943
MSVSGRRAQLFRMEEARRQTQRQLEMIDRQIMRRMTAIILQLKLQRIGHRRRNPADARALLERYRLKLAAITLQRQHEIDALSRKLARQDAAIKALRARLPPDLIRA